VSTAARIVFVLALIVWLGEVLFLSLVVAPTVFRNLPVEEAGRVVSLLFPVYYRIGIACGVALLMAAVILRGASERRGVWTAGAGIIGMMLVATLYAAFVVQPRAQVLRPQLHQAEVTAAVREEFDSVHRLAVQLNSVVLLGGLAIAIIAALHVRE